MDTLNTLKDPAKKQSLKNAFGVYLPALVLSAYFVFEPAEVSGAVLSGARMWALSVLPSMFPFFVVSRYLLLCGAGSALKIKGVSGSAAFALFVSFLSGNPVGAKTVCELYSGGKLDKDEAQTLLAFCGNAGPLFVISAVGAGFFKRERVTLLLFAVNYLSALISGFIFCAFTTSGGLKNRKTPVKTPKTPALSPAPAFAEAVSGSAAAVINVGAYIIFFYVVISMLKYTGAAENGALYSLLACFLELTCGEMVLAANYGRDPVFALTTACAALGWSGLCIVMQCGGYITRAKLDMKRFVFCKLLQAAAGAVLGYFAAILFF